MPRQVLAQVLVNGLPARAFGVVLEAVVAGQLHHARLGLVGGDRRLPDAGQLHEHGFDLAQLDAVTADLHLRVGPAEEDQPLRVGSHEVTAAVGPLPAQGLQRAETRGVLLGVQVARHPGAADNQLADLAPPDRLPAGGVDHGQTPSVQGQPDAHRLAAGQSRRAGHHGGLGRAVGVPHLPCLARPSLSASAPGHASPPRTSRRTPRRESAGHSDASVGTVETTETRRCASHVTSSGPVLTTDRGAGTRQAPWRQASHISSQEASKATDRPARTRSPGPSGSSRRNILASASTNAAALRWVTATPLGVPVVPEVKMIHASSPGTGRRAPAPTGRASRHDQFTTVADDGADASCGPHQFGTVVRVIHVDGHVGRPDRQDGEDGQVKLGSTGRDADTDPVARAYAHRGEPVTELAAPPAAGPGSPAPTGHRQSR